MRCLQELALLTMPSAYQQVVQALEHVSSWINRSLVRASAPPLITDKRGLWLRTVRDASADVRLIRSNTKDLTTCGRSMYFMHANTLSDSTAHQRGSLAG